MKQLTATLIIMLISICAIAQMQTFYHGQPFEKIYVVRDSIKQALNPLFNYCGYKEKSQDFLFMDTSRQSVNISFTKFEKGANPDLKTTGTWLIDQVQITGKYMDIFPIWKKFINPNANLVETQKNGSQVSFKNTITKEDIIVKLTKGDIWMISLHAYPLR